MKHLLIPFIALAVTACGGRYGSSVEAKYACIDWQDAAENRSCQHDEPSSQWLGWKTANTYFNVEVERRFRY